MIRDKYVRMNMDIAVRVSQESYAVRKKVGAVLANERTIAAYGYNGTPTGMNNTCEVQLPDGTLQTKDDVIHAEENALLNIANSHAKAEDYAMFVTMQPCFRCANRIYQAGIKKVYFLEEYRDLSGIMMLLNAGVQVYQVEQDSIRELTKSYVLNKDKQRTMVVLGVDFQVLRGQWNVNARPTAGHRGVILSHDMNSIQELKEKALKYLCDSDSYIHALEARLYEVTEKIYAKIISGEIGILTGHEYLKLINELDIKPKE